jgi:hypothetical protein
MIMMYSSGKGGKVSQVIADLITNAPKKADPLLVATV